MERGVEYSIDSTSPTIIRYDGSFSPNTAETFLQVAKGRIGVEEGGGLFLNTYEIAQQELNVGDLIVIKGKNTNHVYISRANESTQLGNIEEWPIWDSSLLRNDVGEIIGATPIQTRTTPNYKKAENKPIFLRRWLMFK